MSILRGTAARNLITIEKKTLRDRLMLATSMGLMTLGAPVAGLYGTRASAQTSFPIECLDEAGRDANGVNNSDGDADSGETMFCDSTGVVSPGGTPVPIATISSEVDDLSIVIGEERATQVGALTDPPSTSPTVSLKGLGDHSLTIYDGSIVEKEFSTIPYGLNTAVVIASEDGDVNFQNNGIIQSGANGEGIALDSSVLTTGGDLIIDSSDGVMIGSVIAASEGGGKIDLALNQVEFSGDGSALEIDAGATVNDVTISTGAITATGQQIVSAINVTNASLAGTHLTTYGEINSSASGIIVDNLSANAVADQTATASSISTYAAVRSGNGADDDGIRIKQGGDSTVRVTTLENVFGNRNAISVYTDGSDYDDRDITVHAYGGNYDANAAPYGAPPYGLVEGLSIGINVVKTGVGDTTIRTKSNVSGGEYGIKLDHNSAGAALIDTEGEVDSEFGTGIFANGPKEAGTLTINAKNKVTAENTGIYGQAAFGLITITTSEAASIDADTGRGIDGRNEAYANGGLTITAAGAITSYDDGIYAKSDSGSVNITTQSTATITASGAGAYGVYSKANNGTQRIRTQAAINSKADGIRAIQTGTGSLAIRSFSEVESEMGSGIYAKNEVDSGYINVSTYNDVTGNTHGIRVNSNATQLVQIQTIIEANTIGKNGSGMKMTSSTDARLDFLTDGGSYPRGEVSGAEHGIYVTSMGGDIYTDSFNNHIRGTSGAGFYARSKGGDIGLVSGVEINSYGDYAIDADSAGGALTITNASISGVLDTEGVLQAGHAGIKARSGSGTLTIRDIGDINVKENAVNARSEGGAVTVDITGIVSAGGDGVYVRNTGQERTEITLQNDVTVGGSGIYLTHFSSAEASVNTYGTLSGTGMRGIGALHASESNLSIYAAEAISGFDYGVVAVSAGGDISITSAKSVEATRYGIAAAIGEGSILDQYGDMTIVANSVTAQETGILANNYSSGDIAIIVSGAVSDGMANSRMGKGINLISTSGADLTINAAGSVEGETFAISFDGLSDPDSPGANFKTNDTLTLEEGASIDGDVLFNDGNDVFDDKSGLVTFVSGGEGIDTANLSGQSREIAGTGADAFAFEGFEIFNLEPGDGETFILTGRHEDLTEINFGSGRVVLDGALEADMADIALGAFLNARDGAEFTGNLINNGALEIGSSPGIFNIIGNFEQTSTGTMPFEIADDGWDQLFATGTVTLAGTLNILVSLTQFPETETIYTLIDSDLGRIGKFDDHMDNFPDLDFAVTYTDTGVGVNFVPVVVEDPVVEDPVTEDPVTEDPVTEDPVTEDPVTEDPVTEDPVTEDPVTEDPVTEDPVTEDPITEDPVTEDPIVELEPEPVAPLLSQKEIVPSSLAATMFAGELFTEALTQRRLSHASKDRWNYFSAALGGTYDVGNDGNILGWDGGTSGMALGAERYGEIMGHPFQFGLALGYSVTDLDTGPSHAEIENIHLGFFANADFDALHLNGAIAHAWNDYDFQRVIVFGNGPVIALGETEGSTFTIETEGYYDLLWSANKTPNENVFGFGPLITIDNSIGHMNRFKEKHVGILNLTYTGETARQLTVGAGAAGNFRTNAWSSMLIDTGLRVTLESTSGDRSINTDAFLSVEGATFNPSAAALDAERIAIGTDTKIYFTDRLFGQVRYDTRRGDNLIEHEGWAGLTLKF